MFVSDHYAGTALVPRFRNGEHWKKVFGPAFIYLNSSPEDENPLSLWEDAKLQVIFQPVPHASAEISDANMPRKLSQPKGGWGIS